MRRIIDGTSALLSAALITLAFPPFHAGILAWAGLTPFLLALRRASAGWSCTLGLLFGFSLTAASSYTSIQAFSILNFLLISFLVGLYYVIFALLYQRVARRSPALLVLAAPSIWVTMEYVRANLFFLAFPWNFLGHTQYAFVPVIQIADITGVYGISFLVVMINQCLIELPEMIHLKREGRFSGLFRACAVFSVFIAVLAYGVHRIGVSERCGSIRVAVVQANRVCSLRMSQADRMAHMKAYHELSLEASKSKPRLIVWPESSLPVALTQSRQVSTWVEQVAVETGASLLVGGAGYEKMVPNRRRKTVHANTEYLISANGRMKALYDKILLTPFNEEIPLVGIISWPAWVTDLKESFLPGDSYTLFQVDEARFGTPICWENLFPDHFRKFVANGANFMVMVNNDGFFGYTGAQYQTLAMHVFRAVENRVAVVRATTTGVSCFINPNGEIIDRVRDASGKDLFVAGYSVREIPLNDAKTFYTLRGDVFAGIMAAVGLVAVIATLLPMGSLAPIEARGGF